MDSTAVLQINLEGMTFSQAQKALEQAYIGHVLTVTRFNQTKAARIAGMSYNAFRERVARISLKVAAE